MRLFILGPDLTATQPVWMNIFWPFYKAAAQSVPTTLLSVPNETSLHRRSSQWLSLNTHHRSLRRRLLQKVTDELNPNGGNILIVLALRPADVTLAKILDPVWGKFDHTVLKIVDALEPRHLPSTVLRKFDLVTCFCGNLAASYEKEAGLQSLYFPPHTDVLSYHSERSYRPVDLIVVGRRDWGSHLPLHHHFNAPNCERLFLDFVTRTKRPSLAADEFQLLMSMYGRSKVAFCFEPSRNPRFAGRSPLTGRWIHAWAAGCTIIGSTPKGLGVDAQMDWPEATIELPSNPEDAIWFAEQLLEDEEGLARRRRRNVIEALRRHDTRLRLRDLLVHLGIPLPETLRAGLKRLNERASALEVER
jgi:hypothetical protein